MKIKSLLMLFLVGILLSANFYARDNNFELEVYLENTTILSNAKEIPVKITIINKSDDELNTGNLESVKFTFSECEIVASCIGFHKVYQTFEIIPAKKLAKDEISTFDVDLADNQWVSPMSSLLIIGDTHNFSREVPKENIYFQATASEKIGYQKSANAEKKVPKFKYFYSNIITTEIR